MLHSLSARNRDVATLHFGLQVAVAKSFGLPLDGQVRFSRLALPGGRQATFELQGLHGQAVQDRRGLQKLVHEIARGKGWQALAGASTTWSSRGKGLLAFVDCQVIVFLQVLGDQSPPRQLLRLEWEALDGNEMQNLNGVIAHPHWQMDLADFDVQPARPPSDEILLSVPKTSSGPDLAWSSKLHMAASARWMSEEWSDERPLPHVTGPQSLEEVRRWMDNACRYVRFQIRDALTR